VLHHALDQPSLAAAQRPTQSADHASGNSGFKPERITNSDNELTYAQGWCNRQPSIGKRCGLSSQYSKVGSGISSNNHRGHTTPVDEGNTRVFYSLHHVLVGKNVAIGRNNDTGTCSAACSSRLSSATHIYAHYRCAHMFNCAYDCLRIGIEHTVIIGNIQGLVLVQHRNQGMGSSAENHK
jgi:hypothetical protein